MTFSPENNLERMAAEYLATCELDAKNNPKFEFGMFVAILGCHMAQGQRNDLGLGKIVSKNGETWSNRDQQHLYDVYIFEDNITKTVLQQDLERFYLDGLYRTAIVREMRRQGRGSGHVDGGLA